MKPAPAQATLTDLIVFASPKTLSQTGCSLATRWTRHALVSALVHPAHPVREALRQLAASGLVQLRAHRTPIVAAVDEKRLRDMFDVMAELEALCAARASLVMTAPERRTLEQQHAAMGAAMRAGDVTQYRAGNVVFHTLIYEGAHNSYLGELALSTRERLAPYRAAQLEAPERLARSYSEHDTILTAILRGQAQQAAGLMRDHLVNTRAQLAMMTPTAAARD